MSLSNIPSLLPELILLLWRLCEVNAKALSYILRSPRVRLLVSLPALPFFFCDTFERYSSHNIRPTLNAAARPPLQLLDLLVPVIYFVSKYKNDPSQYGLVQIGVYLTLLWSGERNFAVRLNKVGRPACKVMPPPHVADMKV